MKFYNLSFSIYTRLFSYFSWSISFIKFYIIYDFNSFSSSSWDLIYFINSSFNWREEFNFSISNFNFLITSPYLLLYLFQLFVSISKIKSLISILCLSFVYFISRSISSFIVSYLALYISNSLFYSLNLSLIYYIYKSLFSRSNLC